MKPRLGLLSVCLWSISLAGAGAGEQEAAKPAALSVLTEYVSNISYRDRAGKPAGPTTELIRLLAERLGQPIDVEIMPWARALYTATNEANTALFETAMTSDRQARFKWVGPLKIYPLALYGRKNTINPAIPLARLGYRYSACEARDSAYLQHWQQYGFGNTSRLTLTVQKSQCRDMFLQQRADLIIWNEYFNQVLSQQLAAQGTELIKLATVDEVRLYLAFSPEHSDEYIARWQAALEQSYLDGSMRQLYQSVFPEALISQLEQFARQKQALPTYPKPF
ncbi:hypothetical protein WG68_11425 [Arsukibacterium ikkense]|uniref:Solute-binding protein family 3/N-terminal domain-containing protein n=1 Tax=Arsukibacterium ikkense TaxID=336831 RepID=A0A0M2V3W4_9GAMM|nr:transporter substrate-binding domain-containing protein [Arsukibacterium ikkense]KKO45326.1 hypothetical protein WG68_11425 [Arsukibacterium ikkense]